MLPQNIRSITLNSGNIINCKEFKKKATQSPTEEVAESVSSTFREWLKDIDGEVLADTNSVLCVNPLAVKVDKDDRANLKVSVKVFLENYDVEDLKTAVEIVLDNLGVSSVDSLVLSPPVGQEGGLEVEQLKPLWLQLEEVVQEGKLTAIGVSNLDTPELIQLYQWSKVKPSVNQVNLDSCCVIPPEMAAFAKANDVQLLTHNDPKVLLPHDMLTGILQTAVPSADSWRLRWIARYSVLIKCRGIIQNKGYLLHTSLNTADS